MANVDRKGLGAGPFPFGVISFRILIGFLPFTCLLDGCSVVSHTTLGGVVFVSGPASTLHARPT